MPRWKKLYQELNIPPRHTVGDPRELSELKYWILFDTKATWQKFAMALYRSTLDVALQKMRQHNFLPALGIINLLKY